MEVDTLVATLLSLGFDIDGCQQAISEGNLTVEAAVEWLLQRNNSKPQAVDQGESQSETSAQNYEVSHSCSASTDEDKDKQVISRYATDESKKKAQQEFEQRQRDITDREAKKRRLVDKKVRQEVLKQIKEDRENAKSRRSTEKQEKRSVVETDFITATSEPSHSGTSSGRSKKTCKLKIRLSSGKNVTESCESEETLLDIIARIKQCYNETDTFEIIQPFPHKTFTAGDLQESLSTLGLTPGGCLVLKKISRTDIASSTTSQQASGNNVTGNDNEPDQNEPSRPVALVRDVDGREDDEPLRGEPLEGEPAAIPEMEGDHNLGVLQPQHVWGSGVSLGRHPYNPHAIDPVIHAESPAQAAEARSRLQAFPHQVEPEVHSDLVYLRNPDVLTLVDICIKDVATRLPGHHHPVGSLAPLSHRLCSKLLKHLIKKKTLTPKTLNCFIPCQLQRLVLDHYLYATNELFHTIRLFKGLTYLSVQSCTVFTDKALEAIAGLKKIVYLDFSNCTQLTNKCLRHLKTHECLETLKLDNTKVTDEGLCPLFKNCQWNKLHTLSLCKTAVSNKTVEELQVRNLKELQLEQTNVSELQVLKSLMCLTRLNVGGTRITDESLLFLRNHPSLKNLNLHQTQVTDQGLRHLSGLQLVEIRLPNRLNITDVGISFLQGLPLTYLDLTDYVNITDEALRTVGHLTGLIRLSLSKTKISDNGMRFLSGLINLKELDLERTAVGDDGLDVLSNFVRLEELNLSGTRITDNGLCSGKLNCLRFLCKLNLSRTNISDSGITYLKLPELVLLNMDWTLTTEECRNFVGGCPQLEAIRRRNCGTANRWEER